MVELDQSTLHAQQAEELNGHTSSRIPVIVPIPTITNPSTTSNYEPSTLSIHADDPLNLLTDVAPPIHVSTTFRYTTDPTALRPFRPSERPDAPLFPHQETPTEHCYSRLTTHSTSRLEIILSSLLHNPCITYSSGLSAVFALVSHLNPKRVAISAGEGYHGSRGVLRIHSRLSGLEVLDLRDDNALSALQEGDLVWLETPVNPRGLAFDIARYAQIAHSHGAYLAVDSTFAPPPLQDPFVHGADVVMHSGTKYIGGHSDLLCGVLAIRRELAEAGGEGGKDGWMAQLLEDREFLGSVMGGLEGWLGVRSVRTMELRVLRQSENAVWIVKALDQAVNGSGEGGVVEGLSVDDVKVVRKVLATVHHASLQHEDIKGGQGWLAKQMPNGFGPVFSVSLKSGQLAKHLPSKLELFHHATSLGGVESLIEWRTMTDESVGQELLRVSIGIEDKKDLLGDIIKGFRKLVEEFKL